MSSDSSTAPSCEWWRGNWQWLAKHGAARESVPVPRPCTEQQIQAKSHGEPKLLRAPEAAEGPEHPDGKFTRYAIFWRSDIQTEVNERRPGECQRRLNGNVAMPGPRSFRLQVLVRTEDDKDWLVSDHLDKPSTLARPEIWLTPLSNSPGGRRRPIGYRCLRAPLAISRPVRNRTSGGECPCAAVGRRLPSPM